MSIITFLLVIWMLYSELNYFIFPGYKFRFVPDADFTAKLKLNVDMTVAMPCDCKSLKEVNPSKLDKYFLPSDWSGYP